MDADQFDSLTTRLTSHLTRRRSLGALGVLGIIGVGLAEGSDAKRKKKKHKPKKPNRNSLACSGCTVCQTCVSGLCQPKADGTDCGSGKTCQGAVCTPTGQRCGADNVTCGQDGRCLDDVCQPKPTCAPNHSRVGTEDPVTCCSSIKDCYFDDAVGFICECQPAVNGDQCHSDQDCISGSCVGYRCRGCSGAACPPAYRFKHVFGDTGTGPVQFNAVTGLEVTHAGNLLVADYLNHRVQEVTPDGQFVRQFGVTGVPGSDNQHFRYPAGVAVDKDGNIYIADEENHRVQKFSPSGTWLNAWGSGTAGSDVYHLKYPRDVAFDSRNNLYIADAENARVQVFTTAGAYVRTLTHAGFFTVDFVVIDPDDHVWVRSGYIWHEFDANGQYLRKITLWSDSRAPLAIAPDGSLLHVEGTGEISSDHVALYSTGEMLAGSIYSSSAPTSAINGNFEINAITVDRTGNLYFATFNSGSTTLNSNLIFVYTKESAVARAEGRSRSQGSRQKKHRQKHKQTHKGR